MKPSFALKFSHEGIGLLHRVAGGWQRVAEVSLDDPELEQKLKVVRKTANLLEAGRLACKLVVPNSQILYTSVTAPGPGDAARFEQIRAALDGLTPYPASELAFDWDASGDLCAVAAVALETLAEAEEFAIHHKFNPVSFVAIPEDSNFRGEPFFGLTASADAVLEGAEVVDRDTRSIVILGDAKPVVDADAAQTWRDQGATTASPQNSALKPPTSGLASTFHSRRDDVSAAAEQAAIESVMATPARISFVPVGAPGGKPAKSAPVSSPKPAAKIQGGRPSVASSKPKPAAPLKSDGVLVLSSKPAAALTNGAAPKQPNPAAQAIATAPAPLAGAASTLRPPADEAEALTVFGARHGQSAAGGRSRSLGLIIVAILLAALVAVAIWASIFAPRVLSSLIFNENPAQVMDPEQAADLADAQLALVTPDAPVAPAPGRDLNSQAPPSDQGNAVADGLVDAEVARAYYEQTGIWQLPPAASPRPDQETLDDLYIASIEPILSSQDAVALPAIEGPHDTPPNAVSPPAPYGTRFILDQNGRVVASRDGTMSPDGIMIFAGRPKIMPGQRPGTPASALPPQEETPKIAGTAPRPRPGNLIEQSERSLFGGRTRLQMAALRPPPRPASPQIATSVDQAPTKLAVRKSRTPAKRPSNMVVLVALARASTGAAGSKKTVQEQAAAAAPRIAMTTPAATVAPSMPTRASVARRATEADAIHLRQVNLIGVYGTPNQRRALVRLSNGRYIKVSVGDKVDGGRVATISETELRYVKRGRNITLKMPSS